MKKLAAVTFGFVAATAIPAMLFVVATPMFRDQGILTALAGFFVGLVFSNIVTVLFGIPVYYLLLKFTLVRWWACISAGCLIGVILGILIRFQISLNIRDSLILCLIGAVSGFSFWLVWRRGVED